MANEQSPVTSISQLQRQPDAVEVVFQDDALEVLRELQGELGVADPQAVVLKAVQLLYSAVDHEVLLRKGTTTEIVKLWKAKS
jgi:hypothetical protein